jgi:signal transduction histidine kinase
VRISRQDPLVNILVLPLAVAFQLVDAALGFERMAIVLGGMLVLLFVVRALTNLRTAYGTLAEQRIKLATLFDHSGEGIYTVDGDLRIDTLNPAMAELLGQPAEALAQRECAAVCRFQDLHGQRLCPDRCPLVRAHATRLPVSEEVLYQLPDQPPRHLLLTYASVGEPGEPLSLGIGIARDMTAEREAAKLRDEFVSLVTHELRSPLTVSIGYIELLKRALSGATQPLDPQKGTYYVGRIESAERHLLRLVNNLLELARVERPDLELELGWVDLGRLIEETVDGIRTLASEKQQTVTLDLPADIPVIWSAELYLKEVFSNLTSNAVKYTPEGGSVAVTVRVNPARGDWRDGNGTANGAAVPSLAGGVVEVVVRDTGYGMSDEDQARLFSKFFRSGRPEIRKERGTGLGLALTKTMVEKIGGIIAVQSALGKGSTFTVRLPLTTSAPDGSLAPAPARLLASAGDPGPATVG